MTSSWLIRVVAWDGCLPLAISFSPWAIGAMFGVEVAGLCAIFVPMLAICFRASIGWNELLEICKGPPGILRQLLFSVAIIVLMVFEGWASLLHAVEMDRMVDPAPPGAWSAAAGLYAIYLLFVAAAFIPPLRGTDDLETAEVNV